ncbi:MAG: phosphotransferase [Pseudohongiellaceae bacterium]
MDQRKSALSVWARRQLSEMAGATPLQGLAEAEVETVSGDASFRRYFRIRIANASWVLVDAPPTHEDCHRFVRIAHLFREAGLLTPRVLAVDYEQGFMLLEDFGDTLYLPTLLQGRSLNDDSADQLYSASMHALIELQANGKSSELAPYDRKLLRTELSLFDNWFCERFLELTLTDEEKALLDRTWTFLEDAALAQPQVCVHRDYHSRNLMILENDLKHAPGVIDFQDAVVGACTYDLVSLLRDCYIVWPQERVREWALQFRAAALQRGILDADAASTPAQFLRDFDLMGLQRHIKVIGIFCRLNLRDGKPRYMADVPLVIDYVLSVAAQHPEMAEFMQWFQNKVLPLALPKLEKFASGAAA